MNDIEFGLFGVHTLEWLDISRNEITSLDLSEMQKLHYLDISGQGKCFSFNKTLPASLIYINFMGTQLCSHQSICLFHVEVVEHRSTLIKEFFKAYFFEPINSHLLKDVYDLWNLLLRVSWKKHSAAADVNVHKIEESS